jgi:hypothetical protein
VSKVLGGLVCVVLAGSLAFAGGPVAAVSSSSAFELRGSEVKVEGVPSWPVLKGDVIATKAAPALIVFKDGSRVTLQANSKARVENTEDEIKLNLLDGVMQIIPARGSGVGYLSRDVPVKTSPAVETVAATPQTGVKRQALLLPPPPAPISTR